MTSSELKSMINREGSMKKHIAYLKSLHACSEATAYAEQYSSMQEAWEACRRPDWMLWLLSRVNHQDDRAYRLFACWCVRNTPMPDGTTTWDMLTDDSKAAVAVAEQFADGEVGEPELVSSRASADAAYAAADAATDAARAAYYAAAHDAARAAAADAAYAARAAAAAARAARARAAVEDVQRRLAGHAVGRQAVGGLERDHRRLCARAKVAVHRAAVVAQVL